jgi:hypothetical protein
MCQVKENESSLIHVNVKIKLENRSSFLISLPCVLCTRNRLLSFILVEKRSSSIVDSGARQGRDRVRELISWLVALEPCIECKNLLGTKSRESNGVNLETETLVSFIYQPQQDTKGIRFSPWMLMERF